MVEKSKDDETDMSIDDSIEKKYRDSNNSILEVKLLYKRTVLILTFGALFYFLAIFVILKKNSDEIVMNHSSSLLFYTHCHFFAFYTDYKKRINVTFTFCFMQMFNCDSQ